jgi:hypothetical protein
LVTPAGIASCCSEPVEVKLQVTVLLSWLHPAGGAACANEAAPSIHRATSPAAKAQTAARGAGDLFRGKLPRGRTAVTAVTLGIFARVRWFVAGEITGI